MPFAENNGTKFFWTEQGAGEPLLLIMGLGGSHKEWRRIGPKLAEKYRVILFDNRGVGETVFTDEPFFDSINGSGREGCFGRGKRRIGAHSRNVYGRNDRAGIRACLPRK